MTEKRWLKWVCGGIDSNGVVVGHAYWSDDRSEIACHTSEEKACGATWRMNGHDKWLMSSMIPQPRRLTEDEIFKIEDWLIKHGYIGEGEQLGQAGTIRLHATRNKK